MRIATLAMRIVSVERAFRIVRQAARPIGGLSADAAARLEREVGGRCLARSMAIAARLPGASVAIGVAPPGDNWSAHAWVELNGTALNPLDESRPKIATLCAVGPCLKEGISVTNECGSCTKAGE